MTEIQKTASVIMSVYNETKEEILMSMASIASQSFRDFEVIIINDNPVRKEEIQRLLSSIIENDMRFKLYHNEKNIGLALSMNRAANLANSELLIRMDADDVCVPDRFQVIIDEIQSNKCDLVCSRYSYIDEDGNDLGIISPYYNDDVISDKLKKWNVIHHPTVIMRKNVFIKAGQYRNFPCGQDYDLWLRMIEVTSAIHMVDKVLLKYRVRKNSISSQKSMQQLYTMEYIKRLAYERKKKNDSYTWENYQNYLRKNGVFDEKRKQSFERHNSLQKNARLEFKKGNKLKGLWNYMIALLGEKILLKQFIERQF